MKIARFEKDGKISYGAVEGEEIITLSGSVFDGPQKSGPGQPIADVKLLPPTMPSKVVCVGQNYLGHIKELGVPVPEEPVVFLKPNTCLIGQGDDIIYPKQATRVDYEGELALVVKKPLKDASEAEAMQGLLGCSCFNDVTERNWAAKSPFLLTLCKGFDTFGCYGPWIDTEADPGALDIKTYLNGKVMQDDNTANCVFSPGSILSFVSRHMTLLPGDVVITGTPKGIAPMEVGDLVEVEVEGVGKLSNRLTAA